MARINRVTAVLIVVSLSLFSLSCGFQKQADAKFGDQNFKSSIALIELHKVRFGEYPKSLSDLKYTGDWDQLYLSGVEYRRLENGYELNSTHGWVGKPELSYPDEFWHGLGLVKSNVKPGS